MTMYQLNAFINDYYGDDSHSNSSTDFVKRNHKRLTSGQFSKHPFSDSVKALYYVMPGTALEWPDVRLLPDKQLPLRTSPRCPA
jgi:hypothetical protein